MENDDQSASALFEKVHAEATELLKLRVRAAKIPKPCPLLTLLGEVLPDDPVALALIDRALGSPPGTVLGLLQESTSPLSLSPRALTLLGRSLDLELESWIGMLVVGVARPNAWADERILLVREAWARAAEDDP